MAFTCEKYIFPHKQQRLVGEIQVSNKAYKLFSANFISWIYGIDTVFFKRMK